MPRQPLATLSQNTSLYHASDLSGKDSDLQLTPDYAARQQSPPSATQGDDDLDDLGSGKRGADTWADNYSWSTEVYDPLEAHSAAQSDRQLPPRLFSPDSSGGSYSNHSVATSGSIALTQRFSPSDRTSGDTASISPTQTPTQTPTHTPLAYSAITPEFELPGLITVSFGGKHIDLNAEQIEVVLTKCQQLQLALDKSHSDTAALQTQVQELGQRTDTAVELRTQLKHSEARGEDLRNDLFILETSSNQVSSELNKMAAAHAAHQQEHLRLAHELVTAGKAVMEAEERTADARLEADRAAQLAQTKEEELCRLCEQASAAVDALDKERAAKSFAMQETQQAKAQLAAAVANSESLSRQLRSEKQDCLALRASLSALQDELGAHKVHQESTAEASRRASELQVRVQELEEQQHLAVSQKASLEQHQLLRDLRQSEQHEQQVHEVERRLLQAKEEASRAADTKMEQQLEARTAEMSLAAVSASQQVQKSLAEYECQVDMLKTQLSLAKEEALSQLNFAKDEALVEQRVHTQQTEQLEREHAEVQLKVQSLLLQLSQSSKQLGAVQSQLARHGCENSERSTLVESLKTQLSGLQGEVVQLRAHREGLESEVAGQRVQYGVLKTQAEQDTAVLYEEVRRSELESVRLQDGTSAMQDKCSKLEVYLEKTTVQLRESQQQSELKAQADRTTLNAVKSDMSKLRRSHEAHGRSTLDEKTKLKEQLETTLKHQKQEGKARAKAQQAAQLALKKVAGLEEQLLQSTSQASRSASELRKSIAEGKKRDERALCTQQKLQSLTACTTDLLRSCGQEAPKWATSGTVEVCGQLNEQLSSLVHTVGQSMFVLDEANALEVALGESHKELVEKGQLLHAAREELLNKEASAGATREKLVSSQQAVTATQMALAEMQRQLVVIGTQRDTANAQKDRAHAESDSAQLRQHLETQLQCVHEQAQAAVQVVHTELVQSEANMKELVSQLAEKEQRIQHLSTQLRDVQQARLDSNARVEELASEVAQLQGKARNTRGLDRSVSKLRSDLKAAEDAQAASNRRCKEAQSQVASLETKLNEGVKMRRHALEEARRQSAELQQHCEQVGRTNEENALKLEQLLEEKMQLGRAVAELSCEFEQQSLELQQEQADCEVQSRLALTSQEASSGMAAEKMQLQSQLDKMSEMYEILFSQIQQQQTTSSEVSDRAAHLEKQLEHKQQVAQEAQIQLQQDCEDAIAEKDRMVEQKEVVEREASRLNSLVSQHRETERAMQSEVHEHQYQITTVQDELAKLREKALNGDKAIREVRILRDQVKKLEEERGKRNSKERVRDESSRSANEALQQARRKLKEAQHEHNQSKSLIEERNTLIEKLQAENAELEVSKKQLKQMRQQLQQKEAAASQMEKEHAAAANTIAEANDLVVQLTERLQQEEQQKFELCERLVDYEEKLAQSQATHTALSHVHAHKAKRSPVKTTKYLNPVAENSNRTIAKKFRHAQPQTKARNQTQHQMDIWDFRTK